MFGFFCSKVCIATQNPIKLAKRYFIKKKLNKTKQIKRFKTLYINILECTKYTAFFLLKICEIFFRVVQGFNIAIKKEVVTQFFNYFFFFIVRDF